MPAISVIVPCYNQAMYIGECLDSILNQSFTDIEIIVINDGSTDESAEIIKEYEKKHPKRIRFINQSNQGVIACRNNAIRIAKGEYILPIDGDDIMAPNAIRNLYMAMIAGKGDVICGETYFFGARTGKWNLPEPSDTHDFLLDNAVNCSALYRKSDWVRFGGYDSGMVKGCEDWEFWLNFVEAGKRFYRVNFTTLLYRINPASRNHGVTSEVLKELMEYMSTKHKTLEYRRHSLKYHVDDNCGIPLLSYFLTNSDDIVSTANPNAINLICGGTYARSSLPENTLVMLGCGCLPLNSCVNHQKVKVYALRGELSKEVLEVSDDVPLGDIDLLTSKVYPITSTEQYKREQIGIILDVKHLDAPQLDKYRESSKYRIINANISSQLLANEVNRCTAIISSSLRGLVVADAYRIPNVRLSIKDISTMGGDFIFEDYYSSVGRKGRAAMTITAEEIASISDYETDYFSNLEGIQDSLMDAVQKFVADIPLIRNLLSIEQKIVTEQDKHQPSYDLLHWQLTRDLYLQQNESNLRRKWWYCRIMSCITCGKRKKKYVSKKRLYKQLLIEINNQKLAFFT